MPKNKKKQKQSPDSDCNGHDAPPASQTTPASALNAANSQSLPSRPKTKTSSTTSQAAQGSPALVICRNKHWRYISSFHGPWLQLPPEIIETLAYHNYTHPLPQPIDPAVFYDLLKIRRLVDDATDLAVRAASGLVSLKSLDNSHQAHALGLGGIGGGGKQPMLSAERRHKLREQAVAKLARAYRLDEIACSVATMQSASSLEDVASLVLKRDPHNLDAKYVHFFHEKIPSRQLAESTSLHVLDEVIARQPSDCEALRTRATVRIFKEDYKGAAKDLTEALHLLKLHSRHALTAENQSRELQLADRNSWRADAVLEEDQQPSSLEAQLLFARAGVLLSIACLSVSQALEPLPLPSPSLPAKAPQDGPDDEATGSETTASSTPIVDKRPPSPSPSPPLRAELTAGELLAETKILEARKAVRVHAKKALRDYMAYLSNFHYSPDFSAPFAMEFNKKIAALKHHKNSSSNSSSSRRPALMNSNFNSSGSDLPRSTATVDTHSGHHTVYKMNALFVASPPTDLPPYPPTEATSSSSFSPTSSTTSPPHLPPPPPPPAAAAAAAAEMATHVISTIETVTYHPLLTDALHSLLLCHVLIQTSTKELQRHAHMVARICRSVDGYPMFQSSRSPARADWTEILRQGNDWLGLASSWETMCSTASLFPPGGSHNSGGATGVVMTERGAAAAAAAASSRNSTLKALSPSAATESQQHEWQEKCRTEAIHQEAVRRALEDDRVGDQQMFRVAYQAHKRSVEADFVQHDNNKAQQQQQQQQQSLPTSPLSPLPPPAHAAPIHSNGTAVAPVQPQAPLSPSASHKTWSQDEGREYPILTPRASAVARWQREAPSQGGGGAGGGRIGSKGLLVSPLAATTSGKGGEGHNGGPSAKKKKKNAPLGAASPAGVSPSASSLSLLSHTITTTTAAAAATAAAADVATNRSHAASALSAGSS